MIDSYEIPEFRSRMIENHLDDGMLLRMKITLTI